MKNIKTLHICGVARNFGERDEIEKHELYKYEFRNNIIQ